MLEADKEALLVLTGLQWGSFGISDKHRFVV